MLRELFREDLTKIEESIYTLLENIEDPLIREEVKRLVSSGGKRLRPLFLIWAARTGSITEDCYRAAAALELLHTASLIHDDIIDRSFMRRGEDTSLKTYGRKKATSMGTVLSLFAIDQITSMGNERVSRLLVSTLLDLCLGEMKQLEESYNFHCTYEDYLEKIAKKTASLMALPCLVGGHLSGAGEDTIENLYSIGFNIGCSFQILDDIADIVSLPEETGKNSGQDIRSGIITLPYLLLMEESEEFKGKIEALSPLSKEEEFDEVVAIVRDSSVIQRCQGISNSYLDKSLHSLTALNSTETEEKFRYIIDLLYKEENKKSFVV